MELKSISEEEVKQLTATRGKYTPLVLQFINSDLRRAKITAATKEEANVVTVGIRNAVVTLKANINVHKRGLIIILVKN